MKPYKIIVYMIASCLMVGCTITGNISRKGVTAAIQHSTKKQREYIEEKQEQHNKGYVEYIRADSTRLFLVPTATSEGESMLHLEIGEVTVTAPSRSIPERLGKVNIDFVITLPKELMGICQGVDVIPVLHKADESIPLQEITIRGALFNRVQQRNYWQYNRYLHVFNPDESARQKAYERFIYYPYLNGTRLDSVVSNKTTISYFYTQEIKTTEASNKLLITLEGRVKALDHSTYDFPLSDTLKYNVSSMLTFVDTTTRYLTKVIEKYAVVNDRNYLQFGLGSTVINDTLADNRQQLERIEGLMNKIVSQKEFHIDSIILTATASPDGTMLTNENMSKQRAFALRDYLSRKFPNQRMDTLITVRWIGEDWEELEKLMSEGTSLRNHDKIVEMISNRRNTDKDLIDNTIRSLYPEDYYLMLNEIYPKLRAVNFKYDLRRVGMVKDTIHTTIPDTLYARGVKLLKERRYNESLAVLGGFNDRNTAVCLLSLGYDLRAYNVLKELPKHSMHEYLMAVSCARLKRKEEALEHFDKACELNPSLEFRGGLDPEISTLINERDERNQ